MEKSLLSFELHRTTIKTYFMITVFAGTNRKNSNTAVIATHIFNLLTKHSKETVQLLKLEDLPNDLLHADMYQASDQSKALAQIQDRYLIPAQKLFFVVPEYNGGIPGILKLFIDACSIREYNASFKGGKKAAIVGISSGRSGGLRGMDYMTGFLHYLGIQVLPNKLPISAIASLLKEQELTDKDTLKALESQVLEFINF